MKVSSLQIFEKTGNSFKSKTPFSTRTLDLKEFVTSILKEFKKVTHLVYLTVRVDRGIFDLLLYVSLKYI
jgi:hypothetical protein